MLQLHRVGRNVERDIGALAGDGAYAHDLATGERAADGGLALDETSRAPRGAWSDDIAAASVARLPSRSLPGAWRPRAYGRG